jgi:hypothetical protein
VEPGTSLLLVNDHLRCLDLDAIAALSRHPLVWMALEPANQEVINTRHRLLAVRALSQ